MSLTAVRCFGHCSALALECRGIPGTNEIRGEHPNQLPSSWFAWSWKHRWQCRELSGVQELPNRASDHKPRRHFCTIAVSLVVASSQQADKHGLFREQRRFLLLATHGRVQE